jgi:hypothetical protein
VVVRPRDFDDVSIHDGIQRGTLAPVLMTLPWPDLYIQHIPPWL